MTSLLLVGCASTTRLGSDADLQTMLDSAVLPVGAEQTKTGTISAPDEQPACDPLNDETQTWVVHNSTTDVVIAFLQQNPSPGLHVTSTGTIKDHGKPTGADLTQKPIDADASNATLVFSVEPFGASDVQIRLDAQAIPKNSTCIGGGTDQD